MFLRRSLYYDNEGIVRLATATEFNYEYCKRIIDSGKLSKCCLFVIVMFKKCCLLLFLSCSHRYLYQMGHHEALRFSIIGSLSE